MTLTAKRRLGRRLLRRWYCQVRRGPLRCVPPHDHPLAALGYLVDGPVRDGMIDVRRLILVVVHQLQTDKFGIRMAGYRATPIPWGVCVGGSDQHCFEKDLALRPSRGARARRFDLGQPKLLTLALDLHRYLRRCTRRRHMPRPHSPRLPPLWAALPSRHASFAGPEWDEVKSSLLGMEDHYRRQLGRSVLYPLNYVSHAWCHISAVYADIGGMPRRHVFLADRPDAMRGFRGACEFDLLSSRFCKTS